MKFKEFKLWFNDLGIMLKPYWKYGKLYSIIYIVWDAIIGTMSAMLEVLLLETSINQLTAGEGFIKVIITLVIFFAVQIGLGMLGDGMAYFYFNIKQAEISAKIDIEVYNQIRKVDYKYFDTPEFYDSYTLSYGQYAAKSAQTFLQFSSAISLITTISTLVAYILSSTIYVLIVTLVTVAVKVLIEKKGNKLSLKFNEESTPVYRMKSYIQGTLYNRDTAILIDGKPLTKIALRHYRNNVGIAFQEFPLYSLPLRDNLSVYEPANDKEMNIIFKSLSLDKVLEKNNATFDTDLTRNFDENGIMLSGGEKQKLAVARLMTKKFGLLIFDEPTAALDPIAEAELNRMILDKANTSTTILISHRLSNVVNADYIYVVRNGEIAECGTHESLMAEKGFYYKMFELQAENYK